MTLLWSILGDNFCDPSISRIEKILAKFCPKFLDLYASIYVSPKHPNTKKKNSVTTNYMGPWKFVRYNSEHLCSEVTIWDGK